MRIDRDTGVMKSATDLTWNYANEAWHCFIWDVKIRKLFKFLGSW